MKRRKGQVELVIILGIVFLFIVVIFSGVGSNFFASPVPGGVADKQELVSMRVEGIIEDGVEQTLRVMERHGGYLDDPSIAGTEATWMYPANVQFMGTGVAYWQMCENDYSLTKERIEGWFELSVAKYVKDNLKGVVDDFGRNVSFDTRDIDVDINILGWNSGEEKRIDFEVNLPTEVDGYPMPSQYNPYDGFVSTRFGEIIRFASDYAKDNVVNRNLEVFTIYGIYFSKNIDGFGKLPTSGVLTECGQTLHRDPDQINSYLYELVNYVITQLRWWDLMSTDHDIPKIFAIQKLNRETYRGLDIYLRMSDYFAFDNHDVIMITNNDPLVKSSILTPPVCVQEFNMGYDVDYPVIISVKDIETGSFFNFASHVFVKSNGLHMYPGKCGDITSPGQGNCENLQCTTTVRVINDLSQPVEKAFVAFGDCPVGYTDENGRISGPSACRGDFSIYKNDTYEYYLEEDINNQDIESVYMLHRIPFFTAHFREVNMFIDYKTPLSNVWQTCSVCGSCKTGYATETKVRCETDIMDREYMYVEFTPSHRPSFTLPISNVNGSSSDADCMDSDDCQFCIDNTDNILTGDTDEIQQKCQKCTIDCAAGVVENKTVKYIMSGQHGIDGTVLDPYTSREDGGMITTYTLARDEDEIYVNMPIAEAKKGYDYQVSDSEKSCLMNYLAKCDIDPISEEEVIQKTVVMTCSCDNLLMLVNNTGISSETSDMFCRCPPGTIYSSEGCCDRPTDRCTSQVCDGCKSVVFGGECVPLPPCVNCCDVTGLVNYINSEQTQLKTGTRLICE